MVVLQLRQMNVPPGQRVEFVDVPWSEFEAMLLELGDHRSSRIAYSHRTLEIMTPSPEHEVSKELIGDMAKILFDELDIGGTTENYGGFINFRGPSIKRSTVVQHFHKRTSKSFMSF